MASLVDIREALLSGEYRFIQDLYTSHREYCVQYISNRNYASTEDAEDIFSDAILTVRDNIIDQKLKNANNLKSYILGICLNMAREKNRTHKKNSKKENEVRLLLYGNDHNSMTDEAEDRNEMIDLCKKALDALDQKCREIIKLFYLDSLDMKEIAERLGFANANVAKSSKSRCYKKWITEANALRKHVS